MIRRLQYSAVQCRSSPQYMLQCMLQYMRPRSCVSLMHAASPTQCSQQRGKCVYILVASTRAVGGVWVGLRLQSDSAHSQLRSATQWYQNTTAVLTEVWWVSGGPSNAGWRAGAPISVLEHIQVVAKGMILHGLPSIRSVITSVRSPHTSSNTSCGCPLHGIRAINTIDHHDGHCLTS